MRIENQPIVVKIVERSDSPIRDLRLHRMAVGMVMRGEMNIYHNDHCTNVPSGSVYLLEEGVHYVDTRCEDGVFEQIVFYISPEMLQQAIVYQTTTYGLTSQTSHICNNCAYHNFLVVAAPAMVSDFFHAVNRNFRHNLLSTTPACQQMKVSELIFTILLGESECLQRRLLLGSDRYKADFVRTVYNNLFTDASVEQLAEQTNRSLTSFKKEFSTHFHSSPHQWFVAQRLHRARILLTTSRMTISEIGAQCAFTNISHFIKLFKRHYKTTPAALRKQLQERK